MSDAFTDIARDARRGRCYADYLSALERFLKDPTEKNKRAVVKGATETDGVHGGYWGGNTSLSEEIEKQLVMLKDGDKETWVKFLHFLRKDRIDFERFKVLSPFADKLLIAVDYFNNDYADFHGDIGPFIASIIESRGMKVYNGDKYLLVFDKPKKEPEVFWAKGNNDPNKK